MTTDLSFRRTVDRSLVHRYAVSEVFITDLAAVDAETSLIAAQLPISHAYFLDVPEFPGDAGRPAGYDLTLLTECARQASTYVAHVRYGVPAEWKFLMASMSARLDGPRAPRAGDRPGELTMLARTEADRRGGELRTLRAVLDLTLNGEPVGRISGEGRYLTAEEYEFLRLGGRTDAVPLSSGLGPVRGLPVPPAMVGRADPRNVLLTDARRTPEGIAARLGVAGTHPTIFDHPLDHFPGMALIEAAAQAAKLAVAAGAGRPDRTPAAAVTGMTAEFTRFAELDSPVEITANPDRRDAPGASGAARGVEVTLTQGGETVARFALRVEEPAAATATAGTR